MKTLSGHGDIEIDQLGGKDPHSASKAMTEIAIKSFFIRILILMTLFKTRYRKSWKRHRWR